MQRALQFYRAVKTIEMDTDDVRQTGERTDHYRFLYRWRVPDLFYTAIVSGQETGWALSQGPTGVRSRQKQGLPVEVLSSSAPDTPFPLVIEYPGGGSYSPWNLASLKYRAVAPRVTARVTREQHGRVITDHLHWEYPGTIPIGVARANPQNAGPILATDQTPPTVTEDWWFRESDGAVVEQFISGRGVILNTGVRGGKPETGAGIPYSRRITLLRDRVNIPLPETAYQIPE